MPEIPVGDPPLLPFSAAPHTAFHQADADRLPGRPANPLNSRAYPRPPAQVGDYSTLLFFLLWRAARDAREGVDPVRGLLVDVRQVGAELHQPQWWLYCGFHTLAACGLVYSTPIGADEGVDRRRCLRLYLRVDVALDPDVTRRLAAQIACRPFHADPPIVPSDADWDRIRRLQEPPIP